MMNKLFGKIINEPVWLIFFIFYIISIINISVFNIISYHFNIDSGFQSFSTNKFEIFILVVIFAPLFETLIFNLFTQRILFKFCKNFYFIIFFSSLIFGFGHYYSFIYFLYGILAGFILNLFYYLQKEKFNEKKSFLLTSLLHAFYNFTGFIILEIL